MIFRQQNAIRSTLIEFYRRSELETNRTVLWLVYQFSNLLEMINNAIASKNMPLLEWVIDVWNEHVDAYGYHAKFVSNAIKHGHTEIVIWLMRHIEISPYDVINLAVKHEQLGIAWRIMGALSAQDFWHPVEKIYAMSCIAEYATVVRPFRERFMREIAPHLPPLA